MLLALPIRWRSCGEVPLASQVSDLPNPTDLLGLQHQESKLISVGLTISNMSTSEGPTTTPQKTILKSADASECPSGLTS